MRERVGELAGAICGLTAIYVTAWMVEDLAAVRRRRRLRLVEDPAPASPLEAPAPEPA